MRGYLKVNRSAQETFLRRIRNIKCNIPAQRPSHIEIRTTGEIPVGVLRVPIMAEKLRCERCGGESPADARFCIDCGAPLAPPSTGGTTRLPGMRCADCGTNNPEHARFCVVCGRGLGMDTAPASRLTTPPRPTA